MRKPVGATLAAALPLLFAVSYATGQMPEFGTAEDVDFASSLWSAMQDRGVAGMSGDNVIRGFPYKGTEPHGFVLDTLYLDATVDGQQGSLIVKRNFGPEGVSIDEVLNNPGEHLAAVTVMFKREEGYAPESGDWFWAKYLPDGTLDQTDTDVQMSGKVAGCISCHSGAEGGDMVFTTDTLL